MKENPKYKRVVLKLSGEALRGEKDFGIDPNFIFYLAEEIKEVSKIGVEIVIVIGGGNIFRGITGKSEGIERATADYMGMLATIFNGMALQGILEKAKLQTRLLTSLEIKEVAEPFIRRRALRHLEKKRIVIAAGGTGLPFVTTDTTAAIRGLELKCQAIFKATNVDGVYNKDPQKHSSAKKYNMLSLEKAFQDNDIKIMDKAAIDLCRANNMHIAVFNIHKKGHLKKVALGKKIGTVIS